MRWTMTSSLVSSQSTQWLHRVGFCRDSALSPIGFAAVANADDLNAIVAVIAVDNAPSAHTKAEQRWLEAFELLDVTSFGFQKAVERL